MTGSLPVTGETVRRRPGSAAYGKYTRGNGEELDQIQMTHRGASVEAGGLEDVVPSANEAVAKYTLNGSGEYMIQLTPASQTPLDHLLHSKPRSPIVRASTFLSCCWDSVQLTPTSRSIGPRMSARSLFKFALAVTALCGVQAADLPIVDLGYELYQAVSFNSTGNFYNFSNIRYAAPPLGNLRFAPPTTPPENRGQVQTGNQGRICPQGMPAWSAVSNNVLTNQLLGLPRNTTEKVKRPASMAEFPKPDARVNEDCLFLDVYTPKRVFESADKTKNGTAPVLVWLYGGGYTAGNKFYNPAGLLAASGSLGRAEIIFVSLNYRLGAFGFSSGPTFQSQGGTANLGFRDQRFAFEWIQKNIHLFGGDPNKVTVIGESAGGGSIMHQITAYGGKKGKVPFQRAIPQSPGWIPLSNEVQRENTFQRILELTNSTSLAELRQVPSDTLIRANWYQITNDSLYGDFSYGPVVDGDFSVRTPGQALAEGLFDRSVNVMVGHNANEAPYFTNPTITSTEDIFNHFKGVYKHMSDDTLNYLLTTLYPAVFDGTYPYTDDFQRAGLIVSDSIFTCNTWFLTSSKPTSSYSYKFSLPPAYHGFDISSTFYDGGATSITNPLMVTNRTIAVALQEYITSFAKTGTPFANRMPTFMKYAPDDNVLILDKTGIVTKRDINNNDRCRWWQKALYL